MQTENPKIEWYKLNEKDCLKFTFSGTLKEKDAVSAIEKWKEAFASRQGQKITILWNCIYMNGYEPRARYLWQSALKELKMQIESIWLITYSKLIKAGAMVMSVFTTYKINVVSTEKEIQF